jgi:hypothetical protein
MVVAAFSCVIGAPAAHADGSIFVINSLGDAPDVHTSDGVCQTASGDCTLRAAIQQADADAPGAPDEIDFGVPGEITLESALPDLTRSMFITGTTSKNTISRDVNASAFRIFNITAGSVGLENLIMRFGNVPDGCGGGIAVVSFGTLQLTGSTVTLNSAGLGGAGICANGATTITRSTISLNFADTSLGGGVYTQSAVDLTDTTLIGNRARDGGGVFNLDGTVTATRATFNANVALGGGAFGAGGGGGAVFNYLSSSAAFLIDSTVVANTATGLRGGGIENFNAHLSVVNTTIAGNSAATGGGVDDQLSLVTYPNTFLNALIAHNTATVASPDLNSGATSAGNNLIGDGTGAPGFVNGTNSDKVGTAVNPIDAKLETDTDGKVVVKDNGGPTKTVALLSGSPAIDAGSDAVLGSPYSLTTDQRGAGHARKQGTHVDIGAFEHAPK